MKAPSKMASSSCATALLSLSFCLAACRSHSAAPPATASIMAAPASVAATSKPPREFGLLAAIADAKTHIETLVSTPNFTLDTRESLHPGIEPAFSATFSGDLMVAEPGCYRLYLSPEKTGVELKVDGTLVGGAQLPLGEGRHSFSLSYRRASGPARLLVEWSSEVFGREPIPSTAFKPVGWSSQGEHWQQVDQGRALYDDLGCRGCHQRAGDDPHVDEFYHITRRGRGPGLSRAGRRLQPGWIYSFLGNPRGHRNNTKMPKMLHTQADQADVAAFLTSLQEQGANTAGEHGPWTEPALSPEERTKVETMFSGIGCAACHGEGEGKFSLAAVGSKYEPYSLVEYMMRPDNFDHSGRMPSMLRGDEGTLLARWLLENRKPQLEKPAPKGDPARGRNLVESSGCLGCHSIDLAGLQVFTSLAAPRFELLPAQRKGCLSATAEKRYADFDITDADRDALLAYLRVKEVSPSPAWELSRTLDSRGCRHCHETDVAALSQLPEVPPSLRDAGHKLRPDWIARQVEGRGASTRPWYTLRMPRFHRAGAVGPLFAASAGEPTSVPSVKPMAEATSRVVQEGVQYLGKGEGGMSCVTCHRYASFDPKSATPAPDLSTVIHRVRPTWFNRWLKDPLRITPGTQMPAFFSGVDEDFANLRIDAIWTALSLGKKMPTPDGVDLSGAYLPYPLSDKPTVVRTFLEGSGPRSLAVGFKGAAYAFDAESCRLVYTWTGNFLDMRPVWVGHGGEMATPLGTVSYRAAKTPVLSLLDEPNAKPQFKGYAMAKDGPHMEYQLGTVFVDDFVRPMPDGKGFLRTLRLRAGKKQAKVMLKLDPAVQLIGPKLESNTLLLARGGQRTLELTISSPAASVTAK